MRRIKVQEIPTSTWVFEGGAFWCLHDEVEVVDYVQNHLGFQGHYQTESKGYACVDCGESLEGSPEEDRADALAEYQLMEALNDY